MTKVKIFAILMLKRASGPSSAYSSLKKCNIIKVQVKLYSLTKKEVFSSFLENTKRSLRKKKIKHQSNPWPRTLKKYYLFEILLRH